MTSLEEPLGDVFWYCENDGQVRAVLENNWTGICTPILLTGHLTIIKPPKQDKEKSKRSLDTQVKKKYT